MILSETFGFGLPKRIYNRSILRKPYNIMDIYNINIQKAEGGIRGQRTES